MVATRFDLPVTLETKPGWILQEIYNLWPDLSSGAGRVFQLIPILPRSLSIVHRPSSDIAYLLVLSRSLEMKQRAHCLMQICWGDRKWTTATMPTFCNWYTLREFLQPIVTSSTGVKMDVSINGDFLDESLVEVVDGSVVSVRLSEGFSMSLCNDLRSSWIGMWTSFTCHLTPQVIRMLASKLLFLKGEPVLVVTILSVTLFLRIGKVH